MDKYQYPLSRLGAALIALLFLTLPTNLYATVVSFSDNFESYSNGNNLNTLNGGSNWASAWSVTFGSYAITNAVSIQGVLSVIANGASGTDSTASRTFSALSGTSNEIQYYVRKSAVATDQCNIQLYSGATFKGQVETRTDGTIVLAAAAGTQQISASYSANTNYLITIDVDMTNDRWRGKVDGGSYSAYANLDGTSANTVDKLFLQIVDATAGTVDCYWDEVGSPAPAPIVPNLGLRIFQGVFRINNGNFFIR